MTARAPHAAKQPPRIIVKKVYIEGGGGHHGGAWKVAYADFVTAMMAFFLLMWLLGATNEKQRKALADYFGILPPVIHWASRMDQNGTGTERVLAICRALGAERYISGQGGRAYLDHAAFDAVGIRVEYMEYEKREYSQLHGTFTPHVSALDLVANAGPEGQEVIASGSVYWKNLPSRGTV